MIWIYVSVYLYICISIYLYINICIYIYTSIYLYTYTGRPTQGDSCARFVQICSPLAPYAYLRDSRWLARRWQPKCGGMDRRWVAKQASVRRAALTGGSGRSRVPERRRRGKMLRGMNERLCDVGQGWMGLYKHPEKSLKKWLLRETPTYGRH